MTPTTPILMVLISSFVGAIGAFFLKKASTYLNIKTFFKSKNLIIGLILYSVSSIIFIIALKYGELTLLYPLVSTTYIWTLIISNKFLDEKIHKKNWLGILIIIIGVWLITKGHLN